jgi:nucleolar complex protein 2
MDDDDDASFASVDELDGAPIGGNLPSAFTQYLDYVDEGAASHMLELSKLAEKDPEFYKYLQDHDRDLLEFNVDDDADVEGADDDVGEPDATQLPSLTENILRTWQKSLLEVGKPATWFGTVALIYLLQTRSLRALRKLLVAFRSAVFMNEEEKVLAWTIDSPTGRISSLSFNVNN